MRQGFVCSHQTPFAFCKALQWISALDLFCGRLCASHIGMSSLIRGLWQPLACSETGLVSFVFLMPRAMAVRHWTTASATLSLIGPVVFDVADSLTSTYLELPEFPFDVWVPWGIKQHKMIHWVSFLVLMWNDNVHMLLSSRRLHVLRCLLIYGSACFSFDMSMFSYLH